MGEVSIGKKGWEQLGAGIDLPFHADLHIPELTELRLAIPSPDSVTDVVATTRRAVIESLAGDVEKGMSVAVGGGSRGLTQRVDLLRGTIEGLRELGAEPFVVPAMGSHGGGTANGQLEMLASLGMTPETVGVEIRATMETVEVARTPSGMPIYLDRFAAAADRILPVNRIKPHTCFKGPIESGCTKMAVVGFGKQPGAAQIHSCGPLEMRERLLEGIDTLRATGRLLGGVASVESASGDIVSVTALTNLQVGGDEERRLTEMARDLVPLLPFSDIWVHRGSRNIFSATFNDQYINVTERQ